MATKVSKAWKDFKKLVLSECETPAPSYKKKAEIKPAIFLAHIMRDTLLSQDTEDQTAIKHLLTEEEEGKKKDLKMALAYRIEFEELQLNFPWMADVFSKVLNIHSFRDFVYMKAWLCTKEEIDDLNELLQFCRLCSHSYGQQLLKEKNINSWEDYQCTTDKFEMYERMGEFKKNRNDLENDPKGYVKTILPKNKGELMEFIEGIAKEYAKEAPPVESKAVNLSEFLKDS